MMDLKRHDAHNPRIKVLTDLFAIDANEAVNRGATSVDVIQASLVLVNQLILQEPSMATRQEIVGWIAGSMNTCLRRK